MSVMRLYLRVKKDHVWWDDRLAVVAAAVNVVYMLSLWVKALGREYFPAIERISITNYPQPNTNWMVSSIITRGYNIFQAIL